MQRSQGDLYFQGIRVHYTLSVPDGEIPHRVLLLSGPLMTAFSWRKLMPELDDLSCLTACVDMPGYGRSTDAAGLLPGNDMAASLLWGVLDEIDAMTGANRAMWHLAAQGSACRFVMAMHDQYPDSVRSQLHISPVLDPAPVRRLVGRDRRAWYEKNIVSKKGFAAFAQKLAGYPLDAYVLDAMREPLLYPGAAAALPAAAQEPSNPLHPGFCPTMVIWGGRDPLLPDLEKALDRYMPESERHVMTNAGHLLTETHSSALRDYIRGWLRYLM